MSFKPLIIDTGVFKQLPSGQALDAGGWTLPTAGGTDTYQLTADGSGNGVWVAPSFGSSIPANSAANEIYVGTGAGTAAWTTDLAGLTSLTVDNITINGAVISSDTGAISFSNEKLTTTGRIAVGADTYSGVAHNIGLEDPTEGVMMIVGGVASSSDGQATIHLVCPHSYGSNTPQSKITSVRMDDTNTRGAKLLFQNRNIATGNLTTWMTLDEAGIFELDNITINGAVITSDTGAISFSNEKLTTTGTLGVGTTSIDAYTKLDIRGLYVTGSYNNQLHLHNTNTYGMYLGSVTAEQGYITQGGYYWVSSQIMPRTANVVGTRMLNGVFETYVDSGLTPGTPYTPSIITQVTTTGFDVTGAITGDSLTIDNITINGAVITSDTGAISFDNENLTTTGSITAGSISTDTITLTQGIYHNHGDGAYAYDKVFSNYTTGSTITGTLVVDLPIAHTNKFLTFKVRGYNYSSSLGPWEVNFGGYPYNANPDTWYNYRASVIGQVPFTSIRCGYNGNTGKVCLMLGITSTSWHYPLTEIADVVSTGTGMETGWDIAFYTDETNFYNNDADQTDPQTVSWNRDFNAPSADNQALTSTGDKVASWNVTCLADVLALEVPSASGAERKFVLTADSGSQFEIEPAAWPLTLTEDEDIYVETDGNDVTGDGSIIFPFASVERTIEYIGGLFIGDYNLTVNIGEGVFAEAGTLSFQHPFGSQVTFQGVSEQITGQVTNSISASGTSLGFNNLYRYDVTFILPVGKSVSVGDYIAVRSVSGGTNEEALQGCHYVSGWVGGSRTATVQVVYKNGAVKATGTVTCTIELIKTVIAFDNKNGLKVDGTYTGGIWRGLVLQGNYNTSNTSAKYGIWGLNTAVVSVAGLSTSGYAMGIVGFQTGIYAQNNALIFADYSFISKCGTRCANAQNGGILNLRWARLSGANNNGIFAFNGSSVAAQGVQVVGVGNDSVSAYQGAFIDAISSHVDQNNATNAFSADRWASVDATSASYSDAINPATGGNNDGSYIIT